MAEKRKSRRKQDEEKETPTKEEYAVARYLRFNNPVKDGRLAGITVTCFIGCKAVDALMQSKWSASENKTNSLFTNRQSCSNYLGRLLTKGLFHRAIRIEKKKSDRTKSKKKAIKAGSEEETNLEEDKEKRSKKDKKSKKEKEKESDREGEKSDDTEKKKEEKEEKKEEEKKKKEKKLKLGMPDDQRFIDGDEVYVWIYDPVPVKTFIIGLLMVLGAIALCLFPLWPEEVRIGVYYLSLSGAGFLAFILVLFVVRLILFCAIWMCTIGRHHFWFLPNLNEDVGFIDSFRPLYKHEAYTSNANDSDKKLKENDKDGVNNGSPGDATVATPTSTSPGNETQAVSTEKSYEENKTLREAGSESEPSDDQEGFELVDKEELSDEENKDKSDTENITEISEESKKDK